MKVKYDLLFDFKNDIEKKNKEKGLVQLRAYMNGQRRYFSTKIYLLPKEWDYKNNQPKDAYIARLIRNFIAGFQDFEINHGALNGGFKLKDFDIFSKPRPKAPITQNTSFTKFYSEQVEKEGHLKMVTQQNHRNTLSMLTELRKNIEFSDLKFTFLEEFENYLRQTKKLSINTIEKYHRQIRKYINLAIKKDLMAESNNPYKDFKLKKEQTDTLFLLPEEVVRIENLSFNESLPNYIELEKARDMFLFGCFTGLRFSDCYSLNISNFTETNNGLNLKFRAAKTNKIGTKPLYLLFNGKPQNIIRKYWPKNNSLRVFNGMNNAKVNRFLKIIAVMANVDRGLYFKASRDTFATNLYMLSGDDKLVQEQLQHSKREQTDKYVHLVEEIQNSKLEKAFNSDKKKS